MVELLIVIVVIAILATISVVAYTGVQARARNSQRSQDIAQLAKALELYYNDNGQYPASSGSTTINAAWSTTADSSWSTVVTALSTYMGKVPSDPRSTPNVSGMYLNGYSYDYFSYHTYCGSSTTSRQMYLLVYRLEGTSQTNTFKGDCPSNPAGPYSASNYRVVK